MTKLVNAKITMNAMRDAWCVERGGAHGASSRFPVLRRREVFSEQGELCRVQGREMEKPDAGPYERIGAAVWSIHGARRTRTMKEDGKDTPVGPVLPERAP